MLLELAIKDFALIDSLKLTFGEGLNVLTGETGAGKSIIIGAISMILGERANRELIRSGTSKSVIQGVFQINNDNEINEILANFGIDYEDDENLIITRELYAAGRSVARINGVIVNQSVLKLLSKYLIDVLGQHEHQSLLNSTNHINMLDAYGTNELAKTLSEYKTRYKSYVTLCKELESICNDKMERERKIDLLQFQLNEIDSAYLETGEDIKVEENIRILSNSEKIHSIVDNACNDLYNGHQSTAAIDLISRNARSLATISDLDSSLNTYYESMEEIKYKIEDLAREMRAYTDSVEFDGNTLNQFEERLNLINNLKRKYGTSIEEILNYREQVSEELEELLSSEEKIKTYEKDIFEQKESLVKLATNISKIRKKVAKKFEKDLLNILTTLNMGNVSFEISFNNKKFENGEYYFLEKGLDQVEFLISTNIGEDLKPLTKIASGGEISRIMLAFKTILADADNIETLIFDEVDTGISGNTAQVVAEKLKKVANTHQVICITHLPQIASMAEEHFLIEKKIAKNNTQTQVIKLDEEGKVNEVGRLLGGKLTDITLKHAKELIDNATNKAI
ncbi:DNA repair protein RecN [Serpentinicella sp. ANB-PHB4]|uniref:DNA repair protein RecN n=1 Tax=Serpentinicella sp. ANB-PHB4 TaxID=3074076 RepID=UPI00285D6024|nr:DNA repair protein RecN [Serpentinicella sp. ANB-PHB4]MDR5658181.1 DNA repair protein RecN [Serpentinicella sp. ANB-PHB4]